ncbi:steroid Delta-isomerase [Mycolicibacterium cyprinidarum]|uniref:Steroid Delta-isomerase n=1 Tax=Mycolicibacterium cyprinidarum TaxID=2860311 RepID=A0ABQ4V4X1_9MYCO|nr:steroid Delta-isomerase [Mycolicibacterium sp. NGTWS1803]GJF10327.1 steroid Delta-isomerase [Mycolicibacterium sp. NGTWSNA01]GJF15128.1 steroid Delta-isomerase [Mycolicibacterium sp. NGTWS0302]
MSTTRTDLLATAKRSLAAAGAHDRDGWVGLFTADGRVEDPVGSQPHRGHVAIGQFYDTFIGPRGITHHPHVDIVVGTTVVRDLELEIRMAPTLTMQVPTYICYNLRADRDELRIAGLSAYWELPTMIGQFVHGGLAAVPAGIALGRTMFTNQGLSGSLGFLSGFRGLGTDGKGLFARFLDESCGGDEIGIRRLAADIPITLGESEPLTTSDLVKHLSGGTWDKLIRSGRAVAARVERGGCHSVIIADLETDRSAIARIRLFSEIRQP